MTGFATEATITIRALDQARGVIRGVRAELEGLKRAAGTAGANDNVARSMDRARGAVAATTAAVQGQSAALAAAGVAAGRLSGKIGEGFSGASRQVARLNSDLGAVAIRTGETTRIVSGIAKEYGVAANAARAFAAASAVRTDPFRRFGGYLPGRRRPEAMSDEGRELRRALAGAAFMNNFSPSRIWGGVREAGQSAGATLAGMGAAAMAATAPVRAVASSALSMGASIAMGAGVGIAKLALLATKATVAGLAIAGLVAAWKTISFIRGIGQAGQEWANTLERLRNGMNIPPDQMNRVTGAVRNLQTATGATANDAADLAIALSRAGTSTEDLASRSRLAHRLMTSLGSDAQTTATGLESTRRAWSLNNEELGAAADAIHAVQKATGQGSTVLQNLNAMGERARQGGLGVAEAARLLGAAAESEQNVSGSAEAIGEMAARLTKAREESSKFRGGLRQLGLNANQVGDAMRVDATAGIMAFLAAVKRAADAGKDTDKILRDMFDTRQAATNVSNMAYATDRMAEALRRARAVPAGSLTTDTNSTYDNLANATKRAEAAVRNLQGAMGEGRAEVDRYFAVLKARLAENLNSPESGLAKWWSDQSRSFLQGLTGTRNIDEAINKLNEYWDKLGERSRRTREVFGESGGTAEGGFLASINRAAGEAVAKLERMLGIRQMLDRGNLGDQQQGPENVPFRPLRANPIPNPEALADNAPRVGRWERAFMGPERRRALAETERLRDAGVRAQPSSVLFDPEWAPDRRRLIAPRPNTTDVRRPEGHLPLTPDINMFADPKGGRLLDAVPRFRAPTPEPRRFDPGPVPHPLRPSAVPGPDTGPRVVRVQPVTQQVMPSPPMAPLGVPATPFPDIGKAADAMRQAAAAVERLMSPARTPTPAAAAQGAAAPVSRVETPVNVQSTSQVTVTVTPQIDGIEARVRALVDQGKRDLEAAVARGQNDIRNAARGLGRLGGGSSGALGDGPRGGSN